MHVAAAELVELGAEEEVETGLGAAELEADEEVEAGGGAAELLTLLVDAALVLLEVEDALLLGALLELDPTLDGGGGGGGGGGAAEDDDEDDDEALCATVLARVVVLSFAGFGGGGVGSVSLDMVDAGAGAGLFGGGGGDGEEAAEDEDEEALWPSVLVRVVVLSFAPFGGGGVGSLPSDEVGAGAGAGAGLFGGGGAAAVDVDMRMVTVVVAFAPDDTLDVVVLEVVFDAFSMMVYCCPLIVVVSVTWLGPPELDDVPEL